MKIGKVFIGNELILKWLQLEGGCIRMAYFNFENDSIELIIEHPAMPEHNPGEYAEDVDLVFTTYQDNVGNKVNIRQPIYPRSR